jgi:hypothetical protein
METKVQNPAQLPSGDAFQPQRTVRTGGYTMILIPFRR